MKFISDLKQGDRISDIYLCKYKQSATTKNGKNYDNVILQDRTGTIDAKIWEPNSEGIDEFDSLDYVDIFGEVASFNGALQLNIKRARICHAGAFFTKAPDENPAYTVSHRDHIDVCTPPQIILSYCPVTALLSDVAAWACVAACAAA